MAGIIDIIKYEGDNNTFVWKHPSKNFNTKSQLVVHESQEAILFLNGQALDLFCAGRHTLETQNIPLLNKVINLPTGGESPFQCEIYFINKVDVMSIRWGTDSKIQYIDPLYGFPISIGANGEMALSVCDSRKLILKILGTENVLDRQQISNIFRMFLMTKIKTYIAQSMKNKNINIFEIDEQLEVFSNDLKQKLSEDFYEYGVTLKKFFVMTVVKPDGEEQYEKFKNLHFRKYSDIAEAKLKQEVDLIEQQTQSQKIIMESQAIAQKRIHEGYTYQQEKSFEVASHAAQNEGVGEFTNMGIGLGVMSGVGGNISGIVSGTVNGAFDNEGNRLQPQQNFCENCGNKLEPGSLFCENCGTKCQCHLTCKNCGFTFIKPGKFCPKCGQSRG